jgi:putative flippase GtrA
MAWQAKKTENGGMNRLREYVFFLIRYALYSGVAVLCEILAFALGLKRLELPPIWANAGSSVIGLALAWFLTGRRIFSRHSIRLRGHFLWYAWQFGAIALYSFLVDRLIFLGMHYLASKILIVALSFMLNSTFFRLAILRPALTREAKRA